MKRASTSRWWWLASGPGKMELLSVMPQLCLVCRTTMVVYSIRARKIHWASGWTRDPKGTLEQFPTLCYTTSSTATSRSISIYWKRESSANKKEEIRRRRIFCTSWREVSMSYMPRIRELKVQMQFTSRGRGRDKEPYQTRRAEPRREGRMRRERWISDMINLFALHIILYEFGFWGFGVLGFLVFLSPGRVFRRLG